MTQRTIGGEIHIMLDLETLGLSAHAPLISIGAVMLSEDPNIEFERPHFYRAIKSDLSPPFEPDFDTFTWWLRQSDDVRDVFQAAVLPAEAIQAFSSWIHSYPGQRIQPLFWAKPAHVDMPWLEHSFRVYGYPFPWTHRDIRDLQTFIAIADPNGELAPPDTDDKHNALEDAKWQAAYLKRLLALHSNRIA